MSHTISKRVNFYDGMQIDEQDLDAEQSAWITTVSNSTELFAGSGIEKEFASQRVLFDSYEAPASILTLINTQAFDGEPIYPLDSLDNVTITQPSDDIQGNYLNVEVSDAALEGSASLKVFIFGTIFGDLFKQEALVFHNNATKMTKYRYNSIVAIMTQDFRGNQNTLIDGVACRNNGGRLRILESLPMQLATDEIMVEQSEEPNQDYRNFKPATLSDTLDTLLDEIADSADLDKDDLDINLESTSQLTLEANDVGTIIGEKFKARTNNIQKISILLSVEENELAAAGEEFDWSGEIVVGIRKLQTSMTCPVATIPDTAIEFDPEPSTLAEVSFDQADLEALGVVLTDSTQVVDFVFTQSALANPSVSPSIVPDDYYILTIRRSGDVSVGNIVLEVAGNTDADTDETDEKRISIFSQNAWVDDADNDLWFKIYTDALRVADGTAIDSGVQIRSPKIKKNTTTGLEEPFYDNGYSLIDVSRTGENYAIVQQSNEFSDSEPHPSTGNTTFSRIEDVPSISIVSQSTLSTLLDAGNNTIILGMAVDDNPVSNPTISGNTIYPGLQRDNRFTVINPSSDLVTNNVVGSILIPNTGNPSIKYRIIKKETFTDLYGDVNGDGVINASDVTLAQAIGNIVSGDGYSTDLETGSVPSATQVAGVITSKTVSIDEILRADVDADGLVDITDVSLIQQFISLGTAFTAGSSFTRIVLTLENLTDPLTTTVDIIDADSSFNDVPFTNVPYRIDFLPLWSEDNIQLTDLRRFVPKTFTDIDSSDITGSTKSGGTNDFLVPYDLLLGGELLDEDGEVYSVDFEIGTVVLDLPEGSTQAEVDVFNSFIKNRMKFADGSFVGSDALSDNQVRVTAAIKSYVKDFAPSGTPIQDGYDFASVDGYSAIDETIAVLYTQSSGLLRIRADNIRNIPTRSELRTKIVLTVYLKKAGFQNTEQTVSASELSELLISL